MNFTPLTLNDKILVQSYTFVAGLRNCNYSFGNLAAWQHLFQTKKATTPDALALRYRFSNTDLVYMLVMKNRDEKSVVRTLLELLHDAQEMGQPLTIFGAEDWLADIITHCFGSQVTITPLRNSYDYIYNRQVLASLAGGALKAKRNHTNSFRNNYPDYQYRDLSKDLFPQCMALLELWQTERKHENPDYKKEHDSVKAEQKAIEYTFAHWDALDTIGGTLFVENRMVAFTYGCPITPTTFDVCIEKADIAYEGVYAVINQEFCRHLPSQYIYINREEDMGLEGLRKAKTSYHPEELLSFNRILFPVDQKTIDAQGQAQPPHYHMERCTETDDKEETCRWMCRQYGFEWESTMEWLTKLHINWPLSVRAVSKDKPVGYLTMSDYKIEEESEDIAIKQPLLLGALNQYRYTAVFSFIVDEEYRGTKLNYDMLMNIMDELKSYDFIFIPVMHHLKTHTYWRRWGALYFYEDAISKYYLLPFNPAVVETLHEFRIMDQR